MPAEEYVFAGLAVVKMSFIKFGYGRNVKLGKMRN